MATFYHYSFERSEILEPRIGVARLATQARIPVQLVKQSYGLTIDRPNAANMTGTSILTAMSWKLMKAIPNYSLMSHTNA